MKVTGIELLQKIKDNEFSIYQKVTSLDCTYRNCTIGFILDSSNLDEIMNLEFEVQTTEKREENKEIEELNLENEKLERLADFMIAVENRAKINELVRAVNKLIKESEEK